MSHCVVSGNTAGHTMSRPNLFLALWSLYPILFPFYVMGRTLNPGTQKFLSGVPQIADYYLTAVMGLALCTLPFRMPRALVPVVGALVAFVGYTGLINFIWATHLEDMSLLKSTIFYAYDCLLFITLLLLYEAYQDQFLKVTVYSVMASVLLQTVLSPIAVQQGISRQALFFNDENQLGYFCLLATTIFVMISRRILISVSYQAIFYVAVSYLLILSQCRGALLALGVLAVVAMLERPMRLLLVLGTLASVYLILVSDPGILGKTEERLVVAGEYDSAEARGYDRIFNHPEHILFGAGEGAYARFRSVNFASEIHSTYGTLIFSYGIMGTILFTFALFWVAKRDLRFALFLIPAFVYGSTHHGLRSAFFWPMFAVFCCMTLDASADPAEEAPPRQNLLDPVT